MAPPMRELPYTPPVEGENYWVFDDVLADAPGLRERCLHRTDWMLGAPHTRESWPRRRAMPALDSAELEQVEARVRDATGAPRLWVGSAPGGASLNHNCVQVVGRAESRVRPHTDSRALCTYAGVLYLLPDAPPDTGTSFFRQRMPDGRPGGNRVVDPHANLVEAFGTRFVPPDTFVEDRRVPNRFNRLLVYTAAMIHSATAYVGLTLDDSRMAAVFFWMA
jgi:hypothetical protein